MSGHVVDRFVTAAWPDWPKAVALPDGQFRASPEVARMLAWHCGVHPKVSGDGSAIFGRPVIEDRSLDRGVVVFVPARSTEQGGAG